MTGPLKFLIDTNVFIPVEPASREHLEALSEPIAELERLIHQSGNELLVHPELYRDIGRDNDEDRRHVRLVLANKYARLRQPPPMSEYVAATLGVVAEDTHDWIDHCLLNAVSEGAVDFLVTEDVGMHAKAARLDVGGRVLKVADALEMVHRLYETVPPAPPAVEKVDGACLSPDDPIFASLRADYASFDEWFEKVQHENRSAWVISPRGESYAAVCIVSEKRPGTHGMYGSVLKVCTFKVSDAHEGYRFGELLLKALFDYAEANGFDWLYLTVLPDKQFLIDYLPEFGFRQRGQTDDGQLVLAKHRSPSVGEAELLDPYTFHVLFGPPAVKWESAGAFIVPIQPQYHTRLFPEADPQLSLFSGNEPHGNAIRKAYLCRSGIRRLQRGDLLYFYESRGGLGVTVLGVVEEVHCLSDPQDIVRAVGKRTLYRADEIAKLAEDDHEVLAINFRQARLIVPTLSLDELLAHGVVAAPPQSIQSIGKEGAVWLAEQAVK